MDDWLTWLVARVVERNTDCEKASDCFEQSDAKRNRIREEEFIFVWVLRSRLRFGITTTVCDTVRGADDVMVRLCGGVK